LIYTYGRGLRALVAFANRPNRHSREGGNPGLFMNQYFVYIMASERNGTLYIDVTDDLNGRVPCAAVVLRLSHKLQ
jgi:hypothetical protein